MNYPLPDIFKPKGNYTLVLYCCVPEYAAFQQVFMPKFETNDFNWGLAFDDTKASKNSRWLKLAIMFFVATCIVGAIIFILNKRCRR